MSAVVDKVKSNPVLAAAGATVGAVGIFYVLRRFLSSHNGSDSELTDEQKSISTDLRVPNTSSAKRDAASVLADHHLQSPLIKACAAEGTSDETRRSALGKLFNAALRATVPASFNAAVLCAGLGDGAKNQAVAVWLPPGVKLDVDAMAFHGLASAASTLSGSARSRRLPALISDINERTARVAAGRKAYHLAFFAVHASDAGEGVLAPALRRADAAGAICIHVALSPENERKLAAHGFEVAESFTFFDTPGSVLVRSPQ